MRIVAGIYRGRKFNPPSFFKDRPTTDFAKESLFNLLNNEIDLEGKKALDVFSGTGSISFEFMSRGCSAITSVDINGRYLEYIKKTAGILNPDKKIVFTIKSDIFRFLPNYKLDYDIIFADPPYDLDGIDKLPDLIFSNQSLKKDALVVIEHSALTDYSNHSHFRNLRKYGRVNFSFFR
ncbi:MAG: RsmD family RNA methyltransferase [Bacteroidales bacterium]